jgi:hypothetical protein
MTNNHRTRMVLALLVSAFGFGMAVGDALSFPTCDDSRAACVREVETPGTAVPVETPPASPAPPAPTAATEPVLASSAPFRGLNLNHWAAGYDGHGIIKTYHQVGVRATVRALLAKDRAEGHTAVRVMIWHMSYPGTHNWGVIPTSFPPPYPTNLANYVADIKAAGFTWLEIAFGPQWQNSPIEPNWAPSTITTNWGLMQRVRATVESVWPGALYDLQNEGGAHDGIEANLARYLSSIWTWWRASYGLARATVSFHSGRWVNLLEALEPDPTWYEVHVYDAHGAPFAVPMDTKRVVVGETYRYEFLVHPRVDGSLWWDVGRTP